MGQRRVGRAVRPQFHLEDGTGRGLVVDVGLALEAEARRRDIIVEIGESRGLAVIAVDFHAVDLARERQPDRRIAGADRVGSDRAEARAGRRRRIGIAGRAIARFRRVARTARHIARLLGHGDIAVGQGRLLAGRGDRQARRRRHCRLYRLQLLHLVAQYLDLRRLRLVLRRQCLQLLGQRIQLRLQRGGVVTRRHRNRRHRQRQGRPGDHQQTHSRPAARLAPASQRIHVLILLHARHRITTVLPDQGCGGSVTLRVCAEISAVHQSDGKYSFFISPV